MSTSTASTTTDPTCDPGLRSWVESANDPEGDFPIQNLPLGVFRRLEKPEAHRVGVAIGDQIVDLRALAATGLMPMPQVPADVIAAVRATSLNDLMMFGRGGATAVRRVVSRLLAADTPDLRDDPEVRRKVLVHRDQAEMTLPAEIGDYTDFYASVHHATNVGSMFRPDNPLMPNYKHLPVGYHGRASSLVPSGMPIRRPMGQTKADDAEMPVFGPCRLLDYELEMAAFVGGFNPLGSRLTMNDVGEHLFGMVILNDWSARDVQKWEYQPLGPFNAKNFASTISPWVVTLDALAPFMRPGPPRSEGDPPMLDYLRPVRDMAIDITVEAAVASETMRQGGMDPVRLSRGSMADLFWTIEQMLVHHTSTGCPFRPGDLIGTGTISGPGEGSQGCLLELTRRGQNPIDLPDGTQRRFLQDGDEVIIRAWCECEGAARIGFGECRGIVQPAQ